jgi:hypothetical protein
MLVPTQESRQVIREDYESWRVNKPSSGTSYSFDETTKFLSLSAIRRGVFHLIGGGKVVKKSSLFLGDVDKASGMGYTASEIRRHSGTMKYALSTNGNHSPANPS